LRSFARSRRTNGVGQLSLPPIPPPKMVMLLVVVLPVGGTTVTRHSRVPTRAQKLFTATDNKRP